MARLPQVIGTLSSSTKLKFSTIDSSIVEMLMLDASPSGSTDFSSGWTETDNGTNVNISAGIVTMNGSGAWAANGLRLSSGITLAVGYFEIKVSFAVSGNSAGLIQVTNSTSLLNGAVAGQITALYQGSAANSLALHNTTTNILAAPHALNTWYTVRIYVGLSADGTSYRKERITLTGGAYTNETEVLAGDFMTTAFPNPLQFAIQRFLNNANLTSFKEFYWYSGYATDGPYTEYLHDAGIGKTFDNFDLTNLTLPGTVPSTNLKFDYCFSDTSTAYQETYLTLAQLNAIGKITGRYRYIGIRVQSNSDGPTQVLSAKPNADTATDGIGDFPALSKVMADATLQGSSGTLALANVLVAAGGTFDEAARNISAGAGNILSGVTETIQGSIITGTLVTTGGNSARKKDSFKKA